MNDAAVIKATGKAWSEWFAILEERGARSLPHADIARMLHGDYGVSGWWSQSVTVAYEKEIGRRETSQRSAGDYTASTSRTSRGGLPVGGGLPSRTGARMALDNLGGMMFSDC